MPATTLPPIAEDRRLNAAQTRPASTLADQRAARANHGKGLPDPRRVSPGWLYMAARAHVADRSKGLRKSERETIAAEMVLRISRRIEDETAGRAAMPWRNRPPIPRGKVMRWSDVGFVLRMADGRALVSADGRRVLHAAMKAAMDAPRTWRETPQEETPTDGETIGEMAARETDPDSGRGVDASADELARVLSLPLSGARVIQAAMSFGRIGEGGTFAINRAACARHWGVGIETAKTSLKDGKRTLRERFPDPATLLDALDIAADALVEVSRDAAEMELEPIPAAIDRARREHTESGAVVLGAWLPISAAPAIAAARRYCGALTERETRGVRDIAACVRNGGKVIERAPWDALLPYRRDALLVASLSYRARTERAARIAARAIRRHQRGDLHLCALPDMARMAEMERARRDKTRDRMARALVALEDTAARIAADEYPTVAAMMEETLERARASMARMAEMDTERAARIAESWSDIATPAANPSPVAGCHCAGCGDKRDLLARMNG